MSASATDISAAYGISTDLAGKIVSVSDALGYPPEWVSALINYETAGTFSPSVRNSKSTATGLIQFLESTANDLGTTTDRLASMSAITQMDYVHIYLEQFRTRVQDAGTNEWDVYMSVFYPRAIGQGLDYQFGTQVTAVNKSHTVREYRDAVAGRAKISTSVSGSSNANAWLLGGALAAGLWLLS